MSDQKIAEFRERAELAVTPPDPDLLLQRGRALRRRRQIVPAAAVAACAAIGLGLVTGLVGDTTSSPEPTSPSSPEMRLLDDRSYLIPLPSGEYGLGGLAPGGRPEATVELDDAGWHGVTNGAVLSDAGGTVSWGIDDHAAIRVDRCHPANSNLPPTLSRPQVVDRVSRVRDTRVTSAPRPATALGLRGTRLQVSIPINLECKWGTNYGGALMAIWNGPSAAQRVTVDVWVLERGDQLLMLTRSVRGNPSPATIESLDNVLETLRLADTG